MVRVRQEGGLPPGCHIARQHHPSLPAVHWVFTRASRLGWGPSECTPAWQAAKYVRALTCQVLESLADTAAVRRVALLRPACGGEGTPA